MPVERLIFSVFIYQEAVWYLKQVGRVFLSNAVDTQTPARHAKGGDTRGAPRTRCSLNGVLFLSSC